jgi:thioredoxin 1
MLRSLALAAYVLDVILTAVVLTGCGAIVPGAALHADAGADVAAAEDASVPDAALAEDASASDTALAQDESAAPLRLPSDVQGDAYYAPGQVVPASAEEPEANDRSATLASYVAEDSAEAPGGAAVETGAVEEVGPDEFDATVLAADIPVLVDFSARWCGPCQRLAPMLDELAEDRSDVKIVKVDIDQSPQLAQAYRVRSVPTLILFRQGEVTAQHKGTATRAQLDQLLAR